MQTSKLSTYSRRGLSRVEIIVIVAVVAVVVSLVVCAGAAGVFLPALAKARASARQIKCATQTRNVVQAMTIFAQGNKDSYPIPSILDANNQTVATAGRAKDTSDNTLSILIFTTMISPDLLVSPSETNSAITTYRAYQNAMPKAAVNPAKALWDPSFRCDFTTGQAHNSYAMLMANGDPAAPATNAKAQGRLPVWSNTFNATEAVFGNRGPLVSGLDASGNILFDTRSNTLPIHGGRTTWEGNIAYNDNHVDFETTMAPPTLVYRTAGGKKRDILFFDEPDDATGRNMILGIWTKAGTLPGEFKGIHD
jgi:type II secretory pathway pseudopilin PulG